MGVVGSWRQYIQWMVAIYFLYCKELGQVVRVGGSKVKSKAKREEEDDEAEEK